MVEEAPAGQTSTQPSLDKPQRVLKPGAKLRDKCLMPGDSDDAAQAAIANAEQALANLSSNFGEWMEKESMVLSAARDAAKSTGFEDETYNNLFQAAHNLKGQASTLGYPFADEICASLCRLLDRVPDKSRIPAMLVDQHVDAVRAMVKEGATGNDNPKASVLAKKLRDVTNDFLSQRTASERTA